MNDSQSAVPSPDSPAVSPQYFEPADPAAEDPWVAQARAEAIAQTAPAEAAAELAAANPSTPAPLPLPHRPRRSAKRPLTTDH